MKSPKITQILILLLVTTFSFSFNKGYCLELDTGSEYLGGIYAKTISMDFSNANLNDVLKIFSQQSGMNFIAETNVAEKTVNLYFEDVPVEEALERILSANNLTYEIKPGSNIFVVKDRRLPERELISRIYSIQHIVLPSSNLATALSDTTVVASVDNGLLPALGNLLSPLGSLTEDPRTNSIIINDYPSQFPEIEKAIARLDVRIPQILIAAEILDVSDGALSQIGAKFSSTSLTIDGPEKQTLWPFNIDNANSDAETATIDSDGNSVYDRTRTIPGAADLYTLGAVKFPNNFLTLQFLKTHSETKNLARPRILTLNNQTAKIEVTTEEVIGLTSTTTSDQVREEIERKPLGVSLSVTPQANIETGEITLAVLPINSTAKSSSFSSSTQTYKDPETQSTSSIFRVKDGDTVIIGGLLRNTTSSTETKVPFLGDLPFLGRAFKHNEDNDSQRELLVFITPSIVKDTIVEHAPEKGTLQKNFINLIREQNPPIRNRAKIDDTISYIKN